MIEFLRELVRFFRRVRNYLKVLELKLRGVELDYSTTVDSSVQIFPSGGKVSVGSGTYLGQGVILRGFGGSISIGSNCSLNPYCVVDGSGGLVIGNNVRIASHTVIVPANHVFSDSNRPITEQGLSLKGITIEDDVWIGAGVSVLDGVVIRKGTVIGAGSVVTKSTESHSVVAGVPSCKISMRK